MRSWLRKIIFECLREFSDSLPRLILAKRPPGERDYNYPIGSHWEDEERKFVLKGLIAQWEEIKK